MSDRTAPEWFEGAHHWYYAHIETGSPCVISVRRAPRDQDVSDQEPGTLVLQLRPARGITKIVDIEGFDRGRIRRVGILRYVLRRDDATIWVLTVRSPVRRRHHLKMVGGDAWTFDTPFFLRQSVRGAVNGQERLLGGVGPTKRHWGFVVDADRSSVDLLAAVAFLHWKWWCW